MRHFLPALLGLAAACSHAPMQPAVPVVKSKGERATERLIEAVHRPDPALGSLTWLAGTWATRDARGLTVEVWDVPRGGLMLGHGQAYDKDRTSFFEHMRIQSDADGIALLAQPNGGPATTFKLKDRGPQHVVFHAPEHDFPQEIGYLRQGEVLRVHLEGQRGADRQIVDLAYRCVGGRCR